VKTIRILTTFFGILIPTLLPEISFSWGFFGHKRINRMAVMTLPPEMVGFYKRNIDFITEHAVDPDKRRYSNKDEAARHYLDADHYGEEPFKVLPKRWKEAVAKLTEDTLQAYGIVPWHIEKMYYRLKDAFLHQDIDRILFVSAEIGHYIGDSHVPLHTTENYNGQLTGQRGIHGFWESRIPELKAEDYDYLVGRARYIDDPLGMAWKSIKESFAAKDSVLDFERKLNESFPKDRKYSIEQRGITNMQVYSVEYSNAYNDMLNGMVERRMRASIIAVGSIWYTAWVDAGKPNLDKFYDKEVSDSLKKVLAQQDILNAGETKSMGRDCEH
jgi:hypothetical protein